MTSKSWRVGIIGCGAVAENHARAIHSMPERVALRAVADIDGKVAQAKALEWGAETWTTDYAEILDPTMLDAVVICLPHHLHAPAAVAAAQAGLHTLVEKPMADTLAGADVMIAAADAAGVKLMVAENVCFNNTYTRASDLIQSGILGKLFLVRISREHQMHEYLRQRPWFLEQPSGGIMYSGGIHDFELLRMLAGEIEHVYGLAGRKALPEMVGDDTSIALAGLQSGITAVLVESFSLRTPYRGTHVSVHGNKGSMWVYGESIQIYTSARDGKPQLADEITVPSRDTFIAEMAHFLDRIESGEDPITSGREERKPLLAVLATYESMKRGERVYLAEMG